MIRFAWCKRLAFLLALILFPSPLPAQIFVPGSVNIRADRVDVSLLATSGNGSIGTPWSGWETAANLIPANTTLYFRAGYFAMSQKLSMKSGWTVECGGWGGVIKVGTLADDMIYATGVSNLTIRNCQIDATGQTGSDYHGIRIINSSNVLIDGVWVHHAAQDCIRLGPSGNNTGTVNNTRIINSTLEYCGQVGPSGNGVGGTDFAGLIINNNIIRQNLLSGMDLEPTASPGSQNNNTNTTVTGNIINNNSSSGVVFYASALSSGQAIATIANNNIVSNGGAYGVWIRSWQDVTITGNVITASINGVYINLGSLNVTVTGNLIRNCSSNGILVDGTGTAYVTVAGNILRNNGEGLLQSNSANYITNAGNIYQGNTTAWGGSVSNMASGLNFEGAANIWTPQSATTGTAGALTGYLDWYINGSHFKVPYYAP